MADDTQRSQTNAQLADKVVQLIPWLDTIDRVAELAGRPDLASTEMQDDIRLIAQRLRGEGWVHVSIYRRVLADRSRVGLDATRYHQAIEDTIAAIAEGVHPATIAVLLRAVLDGGTCDRCGGPADSGGCLDSDCMSPEDWQWIETYRGEA